MAKKKAKKAQKKSVSKKNTQKPVREANWAPIEPLGDRVLVRPMREEEKRIGALIIPAIGGKEMPDTGTVLAVGEGKYVDGKLAPMRVRVGDRVMFSKYSYDEVTLAGETLYIIKEDNVLAVINA